MQDFQSVEQFFSYLTEIESQLAENVSPDLIAHFDEFDNNPPTFSFSIDLSQRAMAEEALQLITTIQNRIELEKDKIGKELCQMNAYQHAKDIYIQSE